MAGTKMGVVGCGGRMGRMLIAEIAATDGCSVAGGSEAPGSGYVNQDIGELAGIGRIGIPIGETVERLMRDSDVVLEFTSPAATATTRSAAASSGSAASGWPSRRASSTISRPGAPASTRPGTSAAASSGATSRSGRTSCRPTPRNTAISSSISRRSTTGSSSTCRGSGIKP